MQRWPSLRVVLLVWLSLAAVAYVSYIILLRSSPPDELVMASSLGFQASLALVVVGIPAIAFLFVFLIIGAIAKRWLLEVEGRKPAGEAARPNGAASTGAP